MWNSLRKIPPFLISVHLKISALFVVSHFLSVEVSPEIMEVKINPGFRTQKSVPFLWIEVTRPFNRGNRYKDYVHIFRDQILCPLNGGVLKERMISYTVCSIKPTSATWMRLLAYIYWLGNGATIYNLLSPIYNLLLLGAALWLSSLHFATILYYKQASLCHRRFKPSLNQLYLYYTRYLGRLHCRL